MEIGEMVFMILTAVCIQLILIVALYTYWIIPEIVDKVKVEILGQINGWIDSTKADLSNTITINIDEMKQKLVSVISGYRGNKARQLSLAENFLSANLGSEIDPESEEYDSVVTQAIATYGEKIVKAALKSIKPPEPAATETAGW